MGFQSLWIVLLSYVVALSVDVDANFLAYEYLLSYGNSSLQERQWGMARKLVKNKGLRMNCEDIDPMKSICDICRPSIAEFWRRFGYLYKDAHFLPEDATFFEANLTFPGTGHPKMEIDVVRCDFLTTNGGIWNPNFIYVTKGRIDQWTYFVLHVKDDEFVVDHVHAKWLTGVMII